MQKRKPDTDYIPYRVFVCRKKAEVTWILQEETFLLQKFKKTEKISCKIA